MKRQICNKLIVVTRRDLKPGSQNAQSLHALAKLALEQPELLKLWNNEYIVSLSIENEHKLKELITKLQSKDIEVSWFLEPDLNYQVTSICFEGNEVSSKLTSSLPLLMKEYSPECQKQLAA